MEEIRVPAQDSYLDELIDKMNCLLEDTECPMKVQIQLDIALEEMFVNIVHYAYGEEAGEVCIAFETEQNGITITLKDEGVAFDPLSREDPDITLSAEERDIGGLGIYIVKKNMDTVSYAREGNQNIFKMSKNW